MATYGPGIDQSQHAKSVGHIIIKIIHFSKLQLNIDIDNSDTLASFWLPPINMDLDFPRFNVGLFSLSQTATLLRSSFSFSLQLMWIFRETIQDCVVSI